MPATVIDLRTRRPMIAAAPEIQPIVLTEYHYQPVIVVMQDHRRPSPAKPWPLLSMTLWLGPTICFSATLISVWMLVTSVQMVRQWQQPIDLEAQP